jgi:hypothetical protein
MLKMLPASSYRLPKPWNSDFVVKAGGWQPVAGSLSVKHFPRDRRQF